MGEGVFGGEESRSTVALAAIGAVGVESHYCDFPKAFKIHALLLLNGPLIYDNPLGLARGLVFSLAVGFIRPLLG